MNSETRIKIKTIWISLLLLLGFLFLDRVLFPIALFEFPNELEWDTSPWYNFLYHRRNIRFEKEEKGILVAGSSVALYTAYPKQITGELRRSGVPNAEKFRTEFYSHPALSPTDLYYYSDDILAKKPELVVYVLNPADLQLDYIQKTENSETRFDEEARMKDYKVRHQNRFIFPGEFLADHWTNYTKGEFFAQLTKTSILLNRFRSFLYDPWIEYMEHHTRTMRSYHYYTGAMPEEGIFLRGWTPPRFTIECELKDGKLSEDIFTQKPGVNVSIEEMTPSGLPLKYISFDETYAKPGWKPLLMEFKDRYGNKPEKVTLRFTVSPTTSSDEVDARIFGVPATYGIRLPQNFCRREIRTGIAYERIHGLDDDRIETMSDEDYLIDYDRRLYFNPENEGALNRLKKIQRNKEILGNSSYFTWSEIQFLEKTIAKFKANGQKLIIVNSPENPIESKYYKNGNWYKGYLEFLNSHKSDTFGFYDFKDAIPDKKSFLDPHHLTYNAAKRSSTLYTNAILNFLNSSSERKER
ncbi:hypothetical protein [Leptospira alstonii]|uniref:Uncharacterized protein n=2 Tax=Leptospira alstonii TaxID=28452 RepID=M6D5V9_9LEPT|nr:hypothetical protein [Leptospira alstonii]EMJ96633.1 hypothetical protein LEP1GSC194_4341 [Leptospira alstonii serovar Sichuan str. 79601]EQA78719.1 hypothetical protein LEP1GSC193_1727 [Leptospira alstonii serovar Pingchang str. 80-412]